MWDQLVRKNGRKTGWTFGFVAGVHAGWKPLQHGMNKSCSEYYVLDDHSMFSNMFADKGDSGAVVITDGGLVVGLVFAGIAITSVQIITLPGTRDTPDIKTTAVRREDDGSLDLNDLLLTQFYGKRFILVENAEMVVQRSGISGNIIKCC
jgi:hypothetical protein